MVLVDTSIWIDVFRDRRGTKRRALEHAVGDEDIVLTRFQQLELLQGARDERNWGLLSSYLESQEFLEMTAVSWTEAARTYFDLRRRGKSVRSPIACCIAQLAIDHRVRLLHRDRDFLTIASLRPLREQWVDWTPDR